jgi:predicted  nucleic acid-binding Zn-ribbon protein
VQLLHTAVAAAAAGAAQQAGEAAVQAQQLQQMRADLTVAAASRETAERQVQELQGQLKLLQQQSDALRSELHVVSPRPPIRS